MASICLCKHLKLHFGVNLVSEMSYIADEYIICKPMCWTVFQTCRSYTVYVHAAFQPLAMSKTVSIPRKRPFNSRLPCVERLFVWKPPISLLNQYSKDSINGTPIRSVQCPIYMEILFKQYVLFLVPWNLSHTRKLHILTSERQPAYQASNCISHIAENVLHAHWEYRILDNNRTLCDFFSRLWKHSRRYHHW